MKIEKGQTLYLPDFATNTILVRKVLEVLDNRYRYLFRDDTVQTGSLLGLDVHSVFTTMKKAERAFERARAANLISAERELAAAQRKVLKIIGKVPVVTDTVGSFRELEIVGKQKVVI
jgi:hypothetical protein